MTAAGLTAGPAAAAATVVSNDWQTILSQHVAPAASSNPTFPTPPAVGTPASMYSFSTVASSGSFGGGAASASPFGAAVNPATCFGKATGAGVASLGAGGFGAPPSLPSLGADATPPFGAAAEPTTLAPGENGKAGSDSDEEQHIGNCDDCRGYFDAGKDNCKTCGFDLNSYDEIDDDDDEHQRHGEG
jgi:hypothetical protein